MKLPRGTYVLLGVLIAPLPFVMLYLIPLWLSGDLPDGLPSYIVLLYVLALIPLGIIKGILKLKKWRSFRTHFWVTFVLVFIPMLSVYWWSDFIPDASFSYEINGNRSEVFEFSIAGVFVAAITGFVFAACMSIFWFITVKWRDQAMDSALADDE